MNIVLLGVVVLIFLLLQRIAQAHVREREAFDALDRLGTNRSHPVPGTELRSSDEPRSVSHAAAEIAGDRG